MRSPTKSSSDKFCLSDPPSAYQSYSSNSQESSTEKQKSSSDSGFEVNKVTSLSTAEHHEEKSSDSSRSQETKPASKTNSPKSPKSIGSDKEMILCGQVDSDVNYSDEALMEFFKGTDAKIDDPDLVNKKQLTAKQNPLSLVNQLVSKWKQHGSGINLNECWETRDPKTSRSVWHVKVGVAETNKFGVGSDQVKTQAKFLATQRFLKLVMPVGMTWNEVVKLISDKNRVEELNNVLDRAAY